MTIGPVFQVPTPFAAGPCSNGLFRASHGAADVFEEARHASLG